MTSALPRRGPAIGRTCSEGTEALRRSVNLDQGPSPSSLASVPSAASGRLGTTRNIFPGGSSASVPVLGGEFLRSGENVNAWCGERFGLGFEQGGHADVIFGGEDL